MVQRVGGSALDQFGKRLGDRIYEALPEKIRGKRRDADAEVREILAARAAQHGCFDPKPAEAGRRVDRHVEYLYNYPSNSKCGSVRIRIPLSGNGPAHVDVLGGGAP